MFAYSDCWRSGLDQRGRHGVLQVSKKILINKNIELIYEAIYIHSDAFVEIVRAPSEDANDLEKSVNFIESRLGAELCKVFYTLLLYVVV